MVVSINGKTPCLLSAKNLPQTYQQKTKNNSLSTTTTTKSLNLAYLPMELSMSSMQLNGMTIKNSVVTDF